jgi:sec-independent protein translocase protein TatB
MFDIGFSELIMLAVVALVVVGPKRLPVATRTIGTLLGRAQRYVNDVKSDIQRQVDLEELRKVKESMQNMGQELQSSVQSVEQEVSGVASSLSSTTNDSWEGFGEELTTPQPTRRGTHISLPEPSWSEQAYQRRVRERVRNRLRKRFMQKRPRDE